MNRCVIIHGWEGYPEEGWFPWLKRELEHRDFGVQVPAMPNPALPRMSRWVEHLAATVGEPDERTFLVGHSLGCITIIRYLERLGAGQAIGGSLLVAGFGQRLPYGALANFFLKPVNWPAVRSRAGAFAALFSDNDRYVPISNSELFQRELGATVQVLHNRGHFSGSDGCTVLPEALTAVLALAAPRA